MAWTETARYSLEHLRADAATRSPKFLVFRKMACVTGEFTWIARLWFRSFGARLDNPEELDCPRCGREGSVVG